MSVSTQRSDGVSDVQDALPLSLLNDYLYCPRRAALKIVEGWRAANEHTERGAIVHEHADIPGYEVAKGVKLLRALPVFSGRLGLNGKCDIVEQRPDGTLYPVEFKVGKRRRFENDDSQLCAQALCLEEMFGATIGGGAIFHADSKRRREVEFTAELREVTGKAIAELHALLGPFDTSDLKSEIPALPPAVFKPACEECSLFEICLPRVTGNARAAAQAARRLFEI
jgi:CRISPR-associated exonuclease Cas4